MLKNNKLISQYFNERSVNNIYKILPLYEEKNTTLESYISSLLFELYGLEECIDYNLSEFVTLVAVISKLKDESLKENNKYVIKREVFKAIEISKSLSTKVVK